MLRTNLATSPFYNERLVHVVLGLAALLIVGLTVFDLVEWRSLSGRHTQLVGRVYEAERQAATLRIDAAGARRRVDREALERVAAAAREANALIDKRTFSWTELLNRLEATLPADVRVQSIQPATDKEGRLTVAMVVLGRRAEDIEQFIEHMEATGAFRNVVTRAETTNPQGMLEANLEGQYAPPAARED